MKLYPAIDIRGGNCVRLYQGDYDRETVYGDNPADQAAAFADEGAAWIHCVDLDAARSGDQQNLASIAAIAERVDVPLQVGGGVRTVEAAKRLWDAGVTRVVIGTAAVQNPELVRELAPQGQIAVGLDAWGTDIAVAGWEERTGQDLFETVTSFADARVAAFVVTEIARDGTMEGPDLDGLSKVLATTVVPVIASGGVGTLEHLRLLVGLQADGRRLEGVIAGRAIYEQAFTVSQAVAALQEGVVA
ncbi:MAG: 1-(5-phosphoribosyl)-5-[(5-phosphoribosylamino)methylideneamino]imidazole-4-carboxamide isomerase [Acidimicrobiales bacterium]|jgi:phosphoribosylformimino-5-aminoimidazole carboxamide ribotide isomerase